MSDKETIQNRAMLAMISAAFFSLPSAIIVALFIILTGISIINGGVFILPTLAWLMMGIIGEILYIAATVTDPRAQQRAVRNMLTQKYSPYDIENPGARQHLVKAMEYFDAMQQMMLRRSGASKVEFEQVIEEVDDMIVEMHRLGKIIDGFDDNKIINRDRMQARNELNALERRLNAEPDERVKDELRKSIQFKKTQLENLATLESNIKRADIQMDNNVAALGTIYAQMQLIGSKDIDSGSARRLRNQVHDQVMGLQDTIAAIDEVQSASQ